MEEKNYKRLEESRRRVQNKIRSSSQVVGSVDDYSNDEIHGKSTLRRSDGTVIYSSSADGERPRRRVTKMSRKRYRKKNGALIVLILFFAAVLGVSAWLIFRNSKKPSVTASDFSEGSGEIFETISSIETDAPVTDAPETEVPETEAVSSGIVTLSNDEVHDGNLILVNYKYAYVFPEEDILLPMKREGEYYSVSTLDVSLRSEALEAFSSLIKDLYANSGCDDVLVVSSFRGLEKQEEIYRDREERYGSEYAASYVAVPGYSEHHTGLAMDLSVYTEDGATYDIETYPDCAWFMSNYDRYGYILRYPEHKAGVTSINYEGWHYRYVGLPHSIIMDAHDLCLEEYTDFVKSYSYSSALLFNTITNEERTVNASVTTPGANEAIIYFVPASDADTTDVPVPPSSNYEISGNNVDGFVVTVKP